MGQLKKKQGPFLRLFSFVPKGLFVALVASLALHLFLILLKTPLHLRWTKRPNPTPKIRVTLNSKKPKPVRKSKLKQIVDSEHADNQNPKKEAKFYGEKTQNFSRQTVAEQIGAFKTAGLGHTKGSTMASRTLSPKKSSHQKTPPKKKTSKNLKNLKKNLKLSDLAMINTPTQHQTTPAPPKGHAKGDKTRTGVSQRHDFIEDIPLGKMTRLNTVEYKYYGFYHRIKQKLEQYWGHSLRQKAEKLWKSGRRFPASNNRITNLVVTINHKGIIVDITIRSTSGIRELDEAAVESFNRAGPFPNPPKGMIKNGLAQIEWGFVIKS